MKKFILDIEKYKQYSNGKSAIVLFLTTQGLWALFVYRLANTIYLSSIPTIFKKILLLGAVIHQKIIEITTGTLSVTDALYPLLKVTTITR